MAWLADNLGHIGSVSTLIVNARTMAVQRALFQSEYEAAVESVFSKIGCMTQLRHLDLGPHVDMKHLPASNVALLNQLPHLQHVAPESLRLAMERICQIAVCE